MTEFHLMEFLVTIGSKIMDCQHGPDRKKNAKDMFLRQNAKITAIHYFDEKSKIRIHRRSQTGAITQRMWISEIIIMYKATLKQMQGKVDQINLEEKKLRHRSKRILKITFSLDPVSYPLQRVF